LELRAITKKSGSFDRLVIRSSLIPLARWSCPLSLLRLSNGRTATEGTVGRGGLTGCVGQTNHPTAASATRQTIPSAATVVLPVRRSRTFAAGTAFSPDHPTR